MSRIGLFLVVVVMLLSHICQAQIPTQGLVAYYPFNDNANDESGNGNNGIVFGVISPTMDRFGRTGKAFFFDGTTGHIDVPSSTHPLGNVNISYSCWVKSINSYSAKWRPIIDAGAVGNLQRSAFCVEAPNGYQLTYTIDSLFIRFGYVLDADQWVHLVLTKHADDVALYVNGVLTHTDQVSGQNVLSTQMHFGGRGTTDEYFHGAIDDIRIYNRALNVAEIRSLYHEGGWGAVAYYPFSGNALDSSGNGNHGTVIGATLTTDRFGNQDKAYDFNGSGNYIDLPESPSLTSFAESITIVGWVYLRSYPVSGWATPLVCSGNQNDYFFGVSSDGRLYSHLFLSSGPGAMIGGNIVPLNQWVFIGMSYDGSDVNFYINGVHDTTFIRSGTIGGTPQAEDIAIGAYLYNGNFTSFPDGKMDEIRIYNYALNESEIKELYNSGDLILTLLDAEDWGPTGPSGWVDLYTHDGTLVGELQANDSSIVTFSQIPADTGYYYWVHCNRVTAWGPQQFWGGKSGIAVTAGETTYDTHTHNTPYMPNVNVYLDATNELLPDGGNKPVAAGTRLRIELDIKNPAYEGAQSVSAYGGLCLDRDMTAPYDLTRYSSTNSYDTGTIRTVAFYVDAPALPGPYYLSVAAFALSSQYDSSLTGGSGWHDPAFTVLPTPAVPVLEFPGDRSKNIQTSPALRWYTVEGALDYHLQLSTDSTFSSVLIVNDSTVVDTSFGIGPLANNTTYFWRVRSRTAEGMSSFSAPWRFTTLLPLPAQVLLVSPLSGTSVNVATLGFVWRKASPEVTRYWFEIATDSLFGFKMIDSSVTDTFCVRQNLSSQAYWWRVRAGNESGWGEFSEAWRLSVVITGLGDQNEIPTQYALYQNYPNPFNPSTTIRYALPQASNVTLTVFNTLGQPVAKRVQEEQPAGYYEVRFDAVGLASGVYLYRLQAGDFVQTKKLVLLR